MAGAHDSFSGKGTDMSVPGSLDRGLTQWWDRLDKFKVECHSTRTQRSQVYSTAETSDQSLVSTWLDVKRGTSTLICLETDRESGGCPPGVCKTDLGAVTFSTQIISFLSHCCRPRRSPGVSLYPSNISSEDEE